MKTTRTTLLSTTIAAAAVLLAAIGNLGASTLVVSNVGAGDPQTHAARLADGALMPAGSHCLLGAFPGMSATQIEDAFQSGGLAGLLADFVQVGDAFAIGEGDAGQRGHFEISRLEPLKTSSPAASAAGEIPHLIVLDTPGEANASEALVLSFPGKLFPQDVEIGLGSYLAMHLRDAHVVVGSAHASGGFAAVAIAAIATTDYPSWVAETFDPETPAADTLPLADPDGDGLNNLTEFALGLDPTSCDLKFALMEISKTEDGLRLEFEIRGNAPDLTTVVETAESLDGTWQTAAVPFDDNGESSRAADGFEALAVELMDGGATRVFARLRFSLATQ